MTAKELADAIEAVAQFKRDWPAHDPLPPWSEDDGRCDEAPPDSGWVKQFNAEQRGEPE